MRNRIFNHFTYYLSVILEKLLSGKSFFTRKNTMLIVRLDSIGDYVLFRNFLKEIKRSRKFSGYKITLLGNILWKDIAETFDRDHVDKFIWTKKEEFGNRTRWRDKFVMMLKLHIHGYEILLIPNDTKTRVTDYIIKLSGAEKIIYDPADSIFFQNELSRISEEDNDNLTKQHIFQFNRNKKFAENITGNSIEIKKPEINVPVSDYENYIVVFPGAGHQSRRWDPEYFAETCTGLWERTGFKIILCGDKSDGNTASEIIRLSNADSIEDLTGKTTLPELIRVIKGARLLLSNESCAVHIAASVNTPTICISNGNHFGRFNPYPENIAPFIRTMYPEELTDSGKSYFSLVKQFHINSDLNINSIRPSAVLAETEKLLDQGIRKAQSRTMTNECYE